MTPTPPAAGPVAIAAMVECMGEGSTAKPRLTQYRERLRDSAGARSETETENEREPRTPAPPTPGTIPIPIPAVTTTPQEESLHPHHHRAPPSPRPPDAPQCTYPPRPHPRRDLST